MARAYNASGEQIKQKRNQIIEQLLKENTWTISDIAKIIGKSREWIYQNLSTEYLTRFRKSDKLKS